MNKFWIIIGEARTHTHDHHLINQSSKTDGGNRKQKVEKKLDSCTMYIEEEREREREG